MPETERLQVRGRPSPDSAQPVRLFRALTLLVAATISLMNGELAQAQAARESQPLLQSLRSLVPPPPRWMKPRHKPATSVTVDQVQPTANSSPVRTASWQEPIALETPVPANLGSGGFVSPMQGNPPGASLPLPASTDPATMPMDGYPSQYPPGQMPPAQLDGHYLQPPNITGEALFAGQVTASQRAMQLLEENAQLVAEIRRLQAVEQDFASRLGLANNELLQTSQQNAALQNSLRNQQLREQQLLTDAETLRREKSEIMEQSRLLVTAVEQTLDEILFNQLATPPVSDR